MILAIVFAQVWGVLQLILLGTLARTVRVRTVLAAMAVGLYAIGPLTVILQLSWIRVVAALVGKSVSDMTGVASYTVDPFIEEALKLLPLVLLMLIPAVRRQWSLTDCVLIAAAVGSGYGLAEHLYRYASTPGMAEGVSGGWAIPFGRVTPMVTGIFNSLTSWLPPGVWFPGDGCADQLASRLVRDRRARSRIGATKSEAVRAADRCGIVSPDRTRSCRRQHARHQRDLDGVPCVASRPVHSSSRLLRIRRPRRSALARPLRPAHRRSARAAARGRALCAVAARRIVHRRGDAIPVVAAVGARLRSCASRVLCRARRCARERQRHVRGARGRARSRGSQAHAAGAADRSCRVEA